MKRRCKLQGFELAPEWADFPQFLSDMGALPEQGWSLDRVKPECRVYGPGKCRWTDKRTQTQNRRNTRWLEIDGRRLTVKQFADELGLPYTTVHSALGSGHSPVAIAERVRRRRNLSAWVPPETVQAEGFWKAYDQWQGKLLREFKFLASPDVYYLLRWYDRYAAAQDLLQQAGLDELPGEAEEEANKILESEAGRVWRDGRREIARTLQYIGARDPDLAERLTPHSGQHFRSLVRLHRRATQRPPQDRLE